MLTQNEITALSLSPTKKDFVQIWNELLDVAGKLSERWDPTSTNESDPGIVILKALTGIADKLNYNIDKNILEAFMPTAAQEDSMRKLCDMLGYSMKYYRSAETTVNIKYYNPDPSDAEATIMENGLYLPKFTVLTNSDQDISYFTTDAEVTGGYSISKEKPMIVGVPCMEGQLVKCESLSDNNVITANQISETNRFYLPETQVAENGIFIYNTAVALDGSLVDGEKWIKVDNLNVQARDSKVFKFGFDSYESRPYLEFPEGYSKLFGDGIFIYYARTNGVNGNISPRTLTQLELPTSGDWSNVSTESFSVENVFSATSGANAETIRQAYNGFKKTIGTFETLVTCRDYMNKIYSFVENGKPLVSNILVTDIRSDLNKAVTICSCDSAGILYKETPLTKTVIKTLKEKGSDRVVEVEDSEQLLNHFDLVLYPFKSYNQIKSNVKDIRAAYDSSFSYSEGAIGSITLKLDGDNIKTVAHALKTPDVGDIVSINNYLRLSATIATNSKVTTDEGLLIVDNIKKALANAFNLRELDFGDEIPFDSIVEVIEGADTRIKVASLNEPAVYTTFSVLEEKSNNTARVAEYAVASDWLDKDTADKLDRFNKTVRVVDEKGNVTEETVSTFNTDEAREIYNKLAVRNVLAGRVPLFDYNESFKASFYEGVYQVTNKVDNTSELPAELAAPTSENPYTIWTAGDSVYTGQYNAETNETIYTKTAPVYADGVVTEGKNESDGTVANYITDIRAECKLIAEDSGLITDVTLSDGEFVKFRAPNFTTIKTYPAYVNYNLDLASEDEATTAKAAEAISLFDLLDSDRASWSTRNTQVKWQKVLDYFETAKNTNAAQDSYKKTFTIKQLVSASRGADNSINMQIGDLTTTIGVGVNNAPAENTEYTADTLMSLSGCVKLSNKDFTARVEWTPQKGEVAPKDGVPLKLVLEDFANPFVTNRNVLSEAKVAIDTALSTYKDNLPDACTKCSFTIYLDFECVPFEAKSLSAWKTFIKTCSDKFDEDYQYQILDFKPVEESNTIFWRLFGDGYDIGKYVTQQTEKLLEFDKNYFGLLPERYLSGIYLVKTIGEDATPIMIKNNEEYKLRDNEYLYIEYTPSTTTEDGTSKELAAVTEVYGPGTIIRPNGFEAGLVDSEYVGTTAHKEVTFMTSSGMITKEMHSFGANEQVEIRDFAQVTLSADTFPVIYVYKNFNDCPELEEASGGTRKYTLKDGEAIFYTDENKAEFAYFTSGTEVTLSDRVVIGQFDIIELSTILDSGLQEIPWKRLVLGRDDKIIFQEYQYLTLGKGDTVKSMRILDPETKIDTYVSGDTVTTYLNEHWRFCSDVEYYVAGNTETSEFLPIINLHDERAGNGWEACSVYDLNVSSSVAQTLRNTDKVETSIKLTRTNTAGGSAGEVEVAPETGDFKAEVSVPLQFKTNLACHACGNNINIKNVWSNPDGVKSFQVKVFAEDEPVVVKTKPGSVVPYEYIEDLMTWYGEPLEAKDYLELWNQVSLDNIKEADGSDRTYDNALRLSASLLPNTYGVFCIYIDSDLANGAKVWIETIPGTKAEDISLLSTADTKIEYLDDNKTKLLRLYLKPGVNCIRINKSGRIFIKASKEAEGILYFDELRLVNSKVIKYVDDIILNTKGLNLGKLGYLGVATTEDGTLDEPTRAKLHAAYADKAYTEATYALQKADEDIASEYNALHELLPRVQQLVEREQTIAKELDALKALGTADHDRLADLVELYNEVNTTLTCETALLDAINNNVTAEALETALADLLSSFSSVENTQQQILQELSELKDDIQISADSFTNSEIMSDYLELSKAEHPSAGDAFTNTFNKVLTVARENVEKHFNARLGDIADDLEYTVNSDDRARLLEVLNRLKAEQVSEHWTKLAYLVKKLNDVLDTEAISSVLTDMAGEAASATVDYASLYKSVVNLETLLQPAGLSVVASELALAIDENNSDWLSSIVNELQALIHPPIGQEPPEPAKDTLLSMIADLKTKVLDKAVNSDSKVTATDITAAISAINDKFTDYFINKLSIIVGEKEQAELDDNSISGVLASIKVATADISKLVDSLKTTGNDRIRTILGTIEAAMTEQTGYYEELKDVTYDTDTWAGTTVSQFVKTAIFAVWPEYLASRATTLLASIEDTFNELIAGEDLESLDISETAIIQNHIGTTAFTALFDRAKALMSRDQANITVISRISALVQDSDELAEALNAIPDNSVISALITKWKDATDLVLKKQLQASLKTELESAKLVDMQLLNVIDSILWPNIAEIVGELEKQPDDFFEPLTERLVEVKHSILNDELSDVCIPLDSFYLKLLSAPLTEFRSMLESYKAPDTSLQPNATNSLLPNKHLAMLSELATKKLVMANEMSADVTAISKLSLATMSANDLLTVEVTNSIIKKIMTRLYDDILQLETKKVIASGYEEAFRTLMLEEQLLKSIRDIDINHEFYYNAQVSPSLQVELNDGTGAISTLMNPRAYYDINNINNNFVISKLDIDYLDTGIQIARSSRLN